MNFHKLHDAGLGVARGLKICANRLWLPLNEGDVGEAAELAQTGLVYIC